MKKLKEWKREKEKGKKKLMHNLSKEKKKKKQKPGDEKVKYLHSGTNNKWTCTESNHKMNVI